MIKLIDKRGGFTDLFLFLIFGFIVAVIVGVFLFIGATATDKLHETMDDMTTLSGDGNNNVSVVIDNSMGKTNMAFQTLRWTAVLIMFAMILGIFIGSYMVQTKPVFFIPYIFLVIIAIVVAVGMANAYDQLIENETMASTFATMGGINWMVLNFPIVVTLVGFVGGLIMFSRLGKGEEQFAGYR